MKKFLFVAVLILGIVVSGYGFKQVSAAGNINDTTFIFNFGETEHTTPRAKYDSTSAYIKATSIGGGKSFNSWVALKNGTDVSKGNHYTILANTEVWMKNWAYEEHGGYGVEVRLEGRKISGTNTFAASGVWSPDSVGGPLP